jgi:hypothetical protein
MTVEEATTPLRQENNDMQITRNDNETGHGPSWGDHVSDEEYANAPEVNG